MDGAQHTNDSTTLHLGQRGEAVRQLQTRLAQLGYCDPDGNLPMDGDFGLRTHRAVLAFQYDYGLPMDGVVNARLQRAMEHAEKMQHVARSRHKFV